MAAFGGCLAEVGADHNDVVRCSIEDQHKIVSPPPGGEKIEVWCGCAAVAQR